MEFYLQTGSSVGLHWHLVVHGCLSVHCWILLDHLVPVHQLETVCHYRSKRISNLTFNAYFALVAVLGQLCVRLFLCSEHNYPDRPVSPTPPTLVRLKMCLSRYLDGGIVNLRVVHHFHCLQGIVTRVEMNKRIISDFLHSFNCALARMSGERCLERVLGRVQHQVSNVQNLHILHYTLVNLNFRFGPVHGDLMAPELNSAWE